MFLTGKLKRRNNVRAVNLDNIMRKFSDKSLSTKIRNSIRSWHGIDVKRKKGKENIHKRNKPRNVEVLFVRKPVKCDREGSTKLTSAKPSWSFDDLFRFRTYRGRTSLSVYHQRGTIGRKRLKEKLSDLKPCKSCNNCSENTLNKTVSRDSCERNSYLCKKFIVPLNKLPGKDTFKSTKTHFKTSLFSDKASTKHNKHVNTGVQGRCDVGCGDGNLMPKIQSYCSGTNPEFPEKSYDNHGFNKRVHRPLYRNTLSTLMGYILYGLMAIVWSPCVITYLFIWFITYPLRPQSVRAPLHSTDNNNLVGFTFRTLPNREVWRNYTIKNRFAAIRSKFKSKLNHAHALNLEHTYSLCQENDKEDQESVIEPSLKRTIRHQPQFRDKTQMDILYKHNDVNKSRRGKMWRNEYNADLYNSTGWSTYRNETVMQAFHEHYPVALMSECEGERPYLKKTVRFPQAYGQPNVSSHEPCKTLSGGAIPCTGNHYRLDQGYTPRLKRHECRKLKNKGKCLAGAFPSKHYDPITYPLPCGLKTSCDRISKAIVPCSSGPVRKHTCRKALKTLNGSTLIRKVGDCPEPDKCFASFTNNVSDFSHLGQLTKCDENLRKPATLRKVSFCIKRKCPRQPCRENKNTCRIGKMPCACWERCKSIFGKQERYFIRANLHRELTTIRPNYLFFGDFGRCCNFSDTVKSCCRIYKELCRMCLLVCVFAVWGPVFFCFYFCLKFICACT